MTDKEQIEAFGDDLDKLVNRYRDEFDLSLAAAIGALIFKAHNIMQDVRDDFHNRETDDRT